jgi:prolyl 4-hydroxylase
MSSKAGTPSRLRRDLGLAVSQRLDATPGAIRAPTDLAQFWYVPHFLDDAGCDALIAKIDAGRRPSTLLTDRSPQGFRTSESCDMDRWAPEIHAIDSGIADLLGLDPSFGETMQGQRYAPGQQFRAHCDYFHEGEGYWESMKAQGGQRTWTAMIYLNDVEEGGATWFPLAGLRVKPKKGLMLIWNNMSPDGSPNQNTLHEGMAVQQGTKYVITKWFRESPWVRSEFTSYNGAY